LSFALRIPILGERTINEVFPNIDWYWQYRLGMVHNLVCFPLILLFIRSLFPGALGRITTLLVFSIAAIFGLSLFVDTVDLGIFLFAYYLIVAGPVIIVSAYIVIKRAIKQKGSTRIMGLGMVVVCGFGLFAMFENWQNRISASDLAILAFVSFGFFQAIGVAQRHNESVENENRLTSRLERSKAALSQQRQTLESDLHDTLGGRLVDLRIQFHRNFADHPEFDPHRKQIDDLYRTFRGELLFMEDLEFASSDPIRGLHLSLLRRYSEVGRELQFQCDEALQSLLGDDSLLMELLHLTREICTNDLKYGTGESRWRIRIRSSELRILQLNRVAEAGQDWDGAVVERGGDSAVHASRRVNRLGGSTETHRRGGFYCFAARIPVGAVQGTQTT
ncbi:MAG: hypothetical protein KDK33_17270, partial [Leptospiraceae bacterium]|nr:hypothetical protein [Leptospiraceae bacterium]